MKKFLMTLCALALVLSALAGCQRTPDAPTPSPSPSPAPTPAEPTVEFKPGTWLATGGEEGQFWFFDADGASGRTASLADGTGYAFAYEQTGGKATFRMGGEDAAARACDVVVTDEAHITLAWEDGPAQSLTYYSSLGADAFCFYTDEELCRMALRDYEGKNGLADSGLLVAPESGEDGTVTLQIYENLPDHNATAAWYRVDRCTAAGIDMLAGEAVDLSTSPVELRIEFASDALLAQSGTYDEYIAHRSDYQSKVALTARIPLTDFRVVSLEPVEDEEQGFRFRIAGELCASRTLTPDRPLVIGLELPETVPNLGVCYLDGSGAKMLCAISDSGMDGAPLLIPVEMAN